MIRRLSIIIFYLLLWQATALGQSSQASKREVTAFAPYLRQDMYDIVISICDTMRLQPRILDTIPIGSGIILSNSKNKFFIVTAAHVAAAAKDPLFQFHSKSGSPIFVRSTSQVLSSFGWKSAKGNDLAAFQIPFDLLNTSSEKFAEVDSIKIDCEQVLLGEGIYVLGYPASLIQDLGIHVVRDGIIAALKCPDTIFIDSKVYPGTSGGPVFTKGYHQISGIGGVGWQKAVGGQEAQFVGIVSSYISYREAAVSPQTGRTRVVFEENSGIAVIVPARIVANFINSL